ncbi:MAG: class I SAM-dependent methyltransferase family protein [Candidatus Caldarchaeum sp.]
METPPMQNSQPVLKVPKNKAEQTRRELINRGLLDSSRKIIRDKEYVYMPVLKIFDSEFEFVEKTLPTSEKAPEHDLSGSFDIVGELAIINDMDLPVEKAETLAREIALHHRRVKTVLQKIGEVSGEERTASYRVVYGPSITETTHRESGCVFKLDIAKVFFSPRLSTERLRVVSQVRENEVVLDMFAGVGPFSIIIARKQLSATVYAVEKNPEAYRYLVENIALNKVTDRVKPFYGDAAVVVPTFEQSFNRVVMNLPHRSIDYLGTALSKAGPGAVIHLYVAENRDDREETLQKISEVAGNLKPVFERVVKEISPKMVLKVYDLVVA